MLRLSRALNEAVFVYLPDGTRCSVVLLRIGDHSVELGFDFPKQIRILRDDAKVDQPRQSYDRKPYVNEGDEG